MGFILSLFFAFIIIFFVILGIGAYLLSRILGGFDNLVRLVKRMLGVGSKSQQSSSTYSTQSSGHSQGGRQERASDSDSSSSSDNVSHTNTKIFGANEGTYIDFEEVK